ncbi:MAG: TIM barrel protein [Actinomycetales bacterium]|nr:TIM barrel protein [Actinomycetales bacterium]
MKFELGIGPDSWGVWFADDPRQPPAEQFLAEAREAGYRTIEIGPYGYLPTDPAVLSTELRSIGLSVSGGFVFGDLHSPDSWDALRGEIDRTATLLAALQARYLVLIDAMYTDIFTGEMIAAADLDQRQWSDLARTSDQIGRYVADRYGLQVAFHPHAETPIETEEQIRRYLDLTDPEVVSMCLDTGHHAYCGGDVVQFMRDHHQRVSYLHIKSVDPSVMGEVRTKRLPFAMAVQQGAFIEPKYGVIDFVQFRDVLEEIGFSGVGIVEQDMYPAPFDKPKPIAVSTREYMTAIGYR